MIFKAAAAQSSDEGASLGVKAGVNSSHLNLQDASAKASPGFNIGLFSRAAFSKYFAIQPEFNLNVLHSTVSVQDASNTLQFSMLMSYVEFAFSGVVTYHKGFFQLGPYISYLANIQVNNESGSSEQISDISNRNNFYDIDYGLDYTAGMQLKRWDIGIRYKQGLFKTGKEKTPGGELSIFRTNKTSVFTVFGGYYF